MSGFTQNFGLEYLAIGEPMRNTRAILQRMAEKIDAALTRGGIAPPAAQDLVAVAGRVTALDDQAEVALPYQAGWSDLGGGFTGLKVWRVGKTAFMNGLIKNANAVAGGAQAVVATLPVGYRPGNVVPTVQSANGNSFVRVDVQSDGKVFLNQVLSPGFAAASFITMNAAWRLP